MDEIEHQLKVFKTEEEEKLNARIAEMRLVKILADNKNNVIEKDLDQKLVVAEQES